MNILQTFSSPNLIKQILPSQPLSPKIDTYNKYFEKKIKYHSLLLLDRRHLNVINNKPRKHLQYLLGIWTSSNFSHKAANHQEWGPKIKKIYATKSKSPSRTTRLTPCMLRKYPKWQVKSQYPSTRTKPAKSNFCFWKAK